MANKKYEFTGETKLVDGRILHRIRAIITFSHVEAGEIGGWIETESNLSACGNAWVGGNAQVWGNAQVYGNAQVCSNADYIVFKNSWSSMRWFTYTRSNRKWKVGCFYGTGDELVKKAYADSEKSGRCYEAIVRAVEAIETAMTK